MHETEDHHHARTQHTGAAPFLVAVMICRCSSL
jgi:hypothetical protein